MYIGPPAVISTEPITNAVVNTLTNHTLLGASANNAYRIVGWTICVRSTTTIGDKIILRMIDNGIVIWNGVVTVGYMPTHSINLPDPGYQFTVNTAMIFSSQASAVSLAIGIVAWYYVDPLS